MKYYFAPMEGITGYIYRNAHYQYFGHADKYFTPFISPNQNRRFSAREKEDIVPEHNQGLRVIPQILTNQSGDFIWAANQLNDMGYEEINLNLGCPSKTVVTKQKGAGFLAQPERLSAFLDEVCSSVDIKISAKIRLGMDSAEEFYDLITIFNQFPLEELIIHPRIQKDYYQNNPNLSVFSDALSLSKHKICYNGDLFTSEDLAVFTTSYPSVDTVMLGRGLIANPGLISQAETKQPVNKACLKQFHDSICLGYQEIMSGDRNVLFKMKELWFYMITLFQDSQGYAKKIKKAQKLSEYQMAVSNLFYECSLKNELQKSSAS